METSIRLRREIRLMLMFWERKSSWNNRKLWTDGRTITDDCNLISFLFSLLGSFVVCLLCTLGIIAPICGFLGLNFRSRRNLYDICSCIEKMFWKIILSNVNFDGAAELAKHWQAGIELWIYSYDWASRNIYKYISRVPYNST